MYTTEAPQGFTSNGPQIVSITDRASLAALLNRVWRRRGKLIAAAAIATLLAAGAVMGVRSLRPSLPQASLVFRLLFKGAQEGQYPNGMAFAPAEIVSAPVLDEVYRRHHLERELPLGEFRSAFAVVAHNPALDRFRLENGPVLESRSLTPVDRQRAEEDYESKLRALQNGEYELVVVRGRRDARWGSISSSQMLEDILQVWAAQARTRGVFSIDLSIYSERALDDLVNYPGDYTLLLDRLRVTIARVQDNVKALRSIPAAQLIRAGERQVSLLELETSLRDSVEFEFRELSSLVYAFRLFRDPINTEAYLREQLFRLDLERKELGAQNAALKRVLNGMAGIQTAAPSVEDRSAAAVPGSAPTNATMSEGFLDRVLTLSSKRAEIAFRQQLTNQMISIEKENLETNSEVQLYTRSLGALLGRETGGTMSPEAKRVVDEKVQTLLGRLRRAIIDVGLIHRELSRQTLEPVSIYTIVQSAHQSTISNVRLTPVVALAAAGWLALVGGFALNAAWKRDSDASKAAG